MLDLFVVLSDGSPSRCREWAANGRGMKASLQRWDKLPRCYLARCEELRLIQD